MSVLLLLKTILKNFFFSFLNIIFNLEQLLELLVIIEGSKILHDDGDGEGKDQDPGHGTGHAYLTIRDRKLSFLIVFKK